MSRSYNHTFTNLPRAYLHPDEQARLDAATWTAVRVSGHEVGHESQSRNQRLPSCPNCTRNSCVCSNVANIVTQADSNRYISSDEQALTEAATWTAHALTGRTRDEGQSVCAYCCRGVDICGNARKTANQAEGDNGSVEACSYFQRMCATYLNTGSNAGQEAHTQQQNSQSEHQQLALSERPQDHATQLPTNSMSVSPFKAGSYSHKSSHKPSEKDTDELTARYKPSDGISDSVTNPGGTIWFPSFGTKYREDANPTTNI